MQLVQFRSTLIAIVFVGYLVLVHDTHTATMLPDTAPVTRDEQGASIVQLRVGGAEGFAQRRAWVFLLSADASRYLFFFFSLLFGFLVSVVLVFSVFLFFGLLCALTSTRRLARVFAGLRVWSRRFLDDVRSRIAILTIG